MLVPCPRCAGLGSVPTEGEEPEPCKFCEGAGKVNVEDGLITCPHCNQPIRLIATYE